MKTLTPKERGEIYLEVAERVFLNELHICGQLAQYIFDYGWTDKECSSPKIQQEFLEFELFKPEGVEENETWFDGRIERTTCMLLCYEMTKTAKL